ncbi:MAG: glycosyltransferase [Lachnospiraceae bacterium]|nr:glycosyltransferase [Lachnospiraceae bacterium]
MISVVIPNYNAEKYLSDCIESVLSLKIEKQIVVVDDGSSDASLQVLSSYEKKGLVTVIKQDNMGAPIARNCGLKSICGDYVLFLDSDDVVYPAAVEKLYNLCSSEGADIGIGNYLTISQDGGEIAKIDMFTGMETYSREEKWTMIGTIPNPSNKLYKRDLIVNNNLLWANVRIGQDLNYFLNAMLHCQKVVTINEYIYGWRYVPTSISNSVSFKIFDIVESFKYVKKHYFQQNEYDKYDKYISTIEFKHYYFQMEKLENIDDTKLKRIIFDFFKYNIEKIDLTRVVNLSEITKELRNYGIKKRIKGVYCSNIYPLIMGGKKK